MPHTIAENLTRLSNAKDAIAAAIVDKGGTIEAGDGFESFADKIEAISGGGGVLISKNITENGTYYAVDDEADGYNAVTVNVPVNMEIVPYGTLVRDKYIRRNTGEEVTYAYTDSTDFIEIDPDTYYYIFTGKLTAKRGDYDPTCNAYYDANKAYIAGFSFDTGSGNEDYRDGYFLEFPSTAKYIRISQYRDVFSDYKSFIARIRKSYINPNA